MFASVLFQQDLLHCGCIQGSWHRSDCLQLHLQTKVHGMRTDPQISTSVNGRLLTA